MVGIKANKANKQKFFNSFTMAFNNSLHTETFTQSVLIEADVIKVSIIHLESVGCSYNQTAINGESVKTWTINNPDQRVFCFDIVKKNQGKIKDISQEIVNNFSTLLNKLAICDLGSF